jgi:Xaa-Pro aminopeptidase
MGDLVAADRITTLRQWMKARQIDAYIVPHADRYQSEYMTPDEERLTWLTGFTGSNGMAIIAKDKAALFTDGRYMLQAPKQVDTKIFDIYETPPMRTVSWLEHHVKDKGVIAYDPWLVTLAQVRSWEKSAEEKNWTIRAVDENPIDVQWIDKAKNSIHAASLHGLKYAGRSKDDKIKLVLKKVSKKAERILVTDPGLVCWLLNIRGRDVPHVPFLLSQALIEPDGHVTLFTDKTKIPEKVSSALGNRVSIDDLQALLPVLMSQRTPLQIDPSHCPQAIYNFCKSNNIPVIEAEDPAYLLRAMKNWVEIKGAETAHEKDKKAFKSFLTWFGKIDFNKEKVTELDIVKKLHDCRAKDTDFADDSFATIAGFGPNGAIVHYKPEIASNLRLKPNNLLLLDSGGQYYTGTTDITRVLAVGKPTLEMKKHYTAVLKGLIALSSTRFPKGTTGAQLDAIARQPVWALGLDYAHGTGHGVGSFSSVHEGPAGFSYRNQVPLQPGMILSIEPGIYLTGQYGIRLENLVVVVKDKLPKDKKTMYAFQTLTRVPFDKNLIDWPAITDDERLFLAGFGTKK